MSSDFRRLTFDMSQILFILLEEEGPPPSGLSCRYMQLLYLMGPVVGRSHRRAAGGIGVGEGSRRVAEGAIGKRACVRAGIARNSVSGHLSLAHRQYHRMGLLDSHVF